MMTKSWVASPRRTTVRAEVAALAPVVVAGAAGVCSVLHLALVVAGGRSLWSMSLPMLGLSLACLGCVRTVWRDRGTARAGLATMAVAGCAMVLVHLMLQHGHSAGTPHAAEPIAVDLLMHSAVTLAGSQALLALSALAFGRRS